MNILYVVNADIEKPSFGNEQRTRLIYDALCKLGDVYILDVRSTGESWRGRKFLRLSPQRGIKRLVNALWHRMIIRPCKKCIVPFYPFPLCWSIQDYFPGVHFDMAVVTAIEYIGRMTLWKAVPRLYADVDDLPMQVFDTLYAPKMGCCRRTFARTINNWFWHLLEKRLTGCWVANPEQQSMVRPKGKCKLLLNIPFGAEGDSNGSFSTACKLKTPCGDYLFTVGKLSYPPNHLGIDHFLTSVWPLVHTRFPYLKYRIAGADLPEQYKAKWVEIPNVELIGYVDKLEELYSGCLAAVVPISSGGGTCIKTLEALANSRVCISTPFGARGIPNEILAEGRNGIFVYDNPPRFVDVLTRLMRDAELRKRCEDAGKAYIEANYSPEQFERRVLELIT